MSSFSPEFIEWTKSGTSEELLGYDPIEDTVLDFLQENFGRTENSTLFDDINIHAMDNHGRYSISSGDSWANTSESDYRKADLYRNDTLPFIQRIESDWKSGGKPSSGPLAGVTPKKTQTNTTSGTTTSGAQRAEDDLSEYEGNHYVGRWQNGEFVLDGALQEQYANSRVLPDDAVIVTVENGKFQPDNRLYKSGEEQILQTLVNGKVEKQTVPDTFVSDDMEFTGKIRLGYTDKTKFNSNLEVIALNVQDGDSTRLGYDMVIEPPDPTSLLTTNENGDVVVDYSKADIPMLIESDGRIFYTNLGESKVDQIQLYEQKTGKISFENDMFLWDGEPIGEDSINELIFHDKNDYITLSQIDIQDEAYKDKGYKVGDVVPKNGWNVEISDGKLDYFYLMPRKDNPDGTEGVWRYSLKYQWHYLADDTDESGNRLIYKENTGWLTEFKGAGERDDFVYSHSSDTWQYYDVTPTGTTKVWEASDGNWQLAEASDVASETTKSVPAYYEKFEGIEGSGVSQTLDENGNPFGKYSIYDADGNLLEESMQQPLDIPSKAEYLEATDTDTDTDTGEDFSNAVYYKKVKNFGRNKYALYDENYNEIGRTSSRAGYQPLPDTPVNTEGWFSQQVADGTYTVYDPDGNIYSTGNLTEEEAQEEIYRGASVSNQNTATKTVTPVGDGDNTGDTGDDGDLTDTTEEITDMQSVLDQYVEDLASGMDIREAQIKRDDAILAILQSEGVNPEDGESAPYRPWNPITNTAGETITDQSAATAKAVANALSFAENHMSLGMKGLSSAWDATLGKLGVNNPFKWLQKNTAAYRALEERINSAVNANVLAKIQAKETNLGNTLYELQLDGYPIINPEGDIYDQTFYMVQKPYIQAPDGSYLIGEDGKPLANPDYREDLSIYYTKVGPDGIAGTPDDITSAFSKSNILPFQFKRQEGELMDDIGSKLDAVIENSVKPTKFFDAQGNEVAAGTEGAIGLSRDDQIFNQQMQALKEKNLIKGTAGADGIFGTADDTLDDAGPDGILGTEDDPKSILEQLSDDITTYEYGDINTAGSRDRLQSDYKDERRRLVDKRNALEELGTFENMSRKSDAYNALGQAGQNVIDTRNNNFKRLAKQKLFGGSISMDDLKESSTQRPQASDQPLSFNLFGNDFQFGSGSSLDPLAVVNKLGNYREGQELDYDLEDVKQSIMSKIADNNSFSKNFNYKTGEKIPTGTGG